MSTRSRTLFLGDEKRGSSVDPRRTARRPARVLRIDVERDERLLLSVSDAARRLGVGRSTMYELLTAGQVESIHIGRLHRVPVDALVAFIEARRRSPEERQGA